LGSEAKEKLFSGRFPLGEKIRINGIPYEVVGVLKPRPQEGSENRINRVVYIPFSTLSDFRDTRYLDMIWLDFLGFNYGEVERSIRNTLAAQHNFRPDDKRAVFVFCLMEQLTQFHLITMALQVLLAFIGSLTLGIGGVGLMNIMLVSVTQRTREIGVEKAMGAGRFDILVQFLTEALAITVLGGVLGIALAYVVSFSVGNLTFYSALAQHGEMGDIRLIISPSTVLVSTTILALVGLISGMIPAIRASHLDPIEALRYE
jgi:putative ABC transport system permease protein